MNVKKNVIIVRRDEEKNLLAIRPVVHQIHRGQELHVEAFAGVIKEQGRIFSNDSAVQLGGSSAQPVERKLRVEVRPVGGHVKHFCLDHSGVPSRAVVHGNNRDHVVLADVLDHLEVVIERFCRRRGCLGGSGRCGEGRVGGRRGGGGELGEKRGRCSGGRGLEEGRLAELVENI